MCVIPVLCRVRKLRHREPYLLCVNTARFVVIIWAGEHGGILYHNEGDTTQPYRPYISSAELACLPVRRQPSDAKKRATILSRLR